MRVVSCPGYYKIEAARIAAELAPTVPLDSQKRRRDDTPNVGRTSRAQQGTDG
jgi:hypothetical protein